MSRPRRRPFLPSDVRKHIRSLRNHNFSAIEMGEHLRSLVTAGYSKRSLANALECSEGTVRRFIRIAQLPPAAQAAIEAGGSARELLDSHRTQIEAERQQRRMREESEAGALSAQHGKFLSKWLSDQDVEGAYRSQVFAEIRNRIHSAEHWARVAPDRCPLPEPASSAANPLQIIEACRPSETECPLWLGLIATWGARWILRLIPEHNIREAALRYAEAMH